MIAGLDVVEVGQSECGANFFRCNWSLHRSPGELTPTAIGRYNASVPGAVTLFELQIFDETPTRDSPELSTAILLAFY